MNSKCLENSRSKDITERKQDKNELLDLLNSIDEKIKAIDIKHSNIENDLDRIEGIVKHNSEVIKTIDRPYSRKKRNGRLLLRIFYRQWKSCSKFNSK